MKLAGLLDYSSSSSEDDEPGPSVPLQQESTKLETTTPKAYRFTGQHGTVLKKEMPIQVSKTFRVKEAPTVVEDIIIELLGGRNVVIQKWERGDELWKSRPDVPQYSDRWPGVSFGSLSCSARAPQARRSRFILAS